MGMRFRLAMLLALGICVLAPAVPATAQQSFPMVCRGGGAIRASQHLFTSGSVYVQFYFTRGNAPAGSGAALPAGACSWLDRGVAANEPDRTCLHRVHRSVISWNGSGAVTYASSNEAPYLSALSDPTRTFIIHVYQYAQNTRSACFWITAVGP